MKYKLTKINKTVILYGNEMWSGDRSSFTDPHYLFYIANGGLLICLNQI